MWNAAVSELKRIEQRNLMRIDPTAQPGGLP
jgi:hypothetical protein